MREAGMDAASLANLRDAVTETSRTDSNDCEFDGLWPENAPIVKAFLAVGSQWRTQSVSAGGVVTPAGGMVAPTMLLFIGLDYVAVRAGLDAEEIAVTPDLWRGLRVMEAAAAAALNKAE